MEMLPTSADSETRMLCQLLAISSTRARSVWGIVPTIFWTATTSPIARFKAQEREALEALFCTARASRAQRCRCSRASQVSGCNSKGSDGRLDTFESSSSPAKFAILWKSFTDRARYNNWLKLRISSPLGSDRTTAKA